MSKQFIDPNHPFYNPLWIRLLLVAVVGGWAILELMTGEPFWAVIFGAIAVYAAYQFFFVRKPDADGE